MKVNSIRNTPNAYTSSGNAKTKPFSKAAELLEVTGVVVGTSLPMFMLIYLPKAFKKIFSNKKEK